jgi:Fur family transcriptional regulator, ferric uptake regulator
VPAEPSPAGWDAQLRSRGYRVTSQRSLVLAAVAELGHATPEEILGRVQAESPRLNLSTVYRTLEVLEEVGLVTHAHLGHGSPTYHSAADVHIHLVCGACGGVQSIPAETARDFLDSLDGRHGFSTDVGHMAIHGRCASCREGVGHG